MTDTKHSPRLTATPGVRVGADRATLEPFATFGEQLRAVMRASTMNSVDPRLRQIAGTPSGMNESVGSEGGFMVQPNFVETILDRAYQLGQILRRVQRFPVPRGTSGASIPAWDEVSRADGQRMGGVQAFWLDEADTVTAKKPKLRKLQPRLGKLITLCYLTDELDVDAPSFTGMMSAAFAKEIVFMTEDAIVNGTLAVSGLLKSQALIQIQKEAGQATGTFVANNAAKMFARLYASANPDGVAWLVNQDVLPQLLTMQLTAATGAIAAVAPLYVPAVGGDTDAPFGRVIGRPVLPCEYCPALSTQGDVTLVDLHEYLIADEDSEQLRSIHVKFLTDELAFRMTYRVGGMPIWHLPTTPKNGTETIAPIVVLQSR